MNLDPVIRRRVALVSAMSAALIATGYAASEHGRANVLNCRVSSMEMQAARTPASPSAEVSADDSSVPKIRQAARDYIQEKKPGAKVEGVFTLVLGRDKSLAIAGADTTIEGKRRTIDLLVRLYTRKSGGTYWRAEPMGQQRAAALMDTAGENGSPAASDTSASDSLSE
jgi:hypothetical protein